MTEEKVERLIKAFTVAGVLLLVIFFSIIFYQLIQIHVTKQEKAYLETQILEYQQIIDQNRKDLEYYQTEEYLEQAARKYNFIYSGDKQ